MSITHTSPFGSGPKRRREVSTYLGSTSNASVPQFRQESRPEERGLAASGFAVQHAEARVRMSDPLKERAGIDLAPVEAIPVRFVKRDEPAKCGALRQRSILVCGSRTQQSVTERGDCRKAQEQKIVDAGLTPERETIDRRKQRRLARRSVHDRGVRAGGPGGKEASRSGREAAPASRNPMRPICWPMRPS